MDLNDALVPFLPAGMSAQQSHEYAISSTRVVLLSELSELIATMKQALHAPRYVLTQVSSAELMEMVIDKRNCDLAIVDIERQDAWPETTFSRFNDAAVSCPIIILCKHRREIPNYIRGAKRATEIVSYEEISDPRFLNLIEAALFRAEIIKSIDAGDDWDWTPPPAA